MQASITDSSTWVSLRSWCRLRWRINVISRWLRRSIWGWEVHRSDLLEPGKPNRLRHSVLSWEDSFSCSIVMKPSTSMLWVVFLWVCVKWELGVVSMNSIVLRRGCYLHALSRSWSYRRVWGRSKRRSSWCRRRLAWVHSWVYSSPWTLVMLDVPTCPRIWSNCSVKWPWWNRTVNSSLRSCSTRRAFERLKDLLVRSCHCSNYAPINWVRSRITISGSEPWNPCWTLQATWSDLKWLSGSKNLSSRLNSMISKGRSYYEVFVIPLYLNWSRRIFPYCRPFFRVCSREARFLKSRNSSWGRRLARSALSVICYQLRTLLRRCCSCSKFNEYRMVWCWLAHVGVVSLQHGVCCWNRCFDATRWRVIPISSTLKPSRRMNCMDV